MKGLIQFIQILNRQVLPLVLLMLSFGASAQNVTVSGTIRTVSGATLNEVGLEIFEAGSGQNISSLHFVNGQYTVTLPVGESITLSPNKDDDPLNGVSTFDLVLLARHVSGVQPFTSPYQYIAADANNNGLIGLDDSLELRNLILGIYTELPQNASWRFVPANYVFPDAMHPFPFPEVITTGPLTGNLTGVDFIAIKIGDLNNSSLPFPLGGWNPYNSAIIGSAKIDQNANCLGDVSEPALADWLVTARDGTHEYFATTRDNGDYSLFAPSGNYDVWLTPPNSLWGVCADTVFGLQLDNFETDTAQFAANAQSDCALLEVDLSAQLIRRCFANTYKVHYCNKGTVAAENASVEVEFDPYFTITASSLPWTEVNGNTYTFDVGDVPAGYCGEFNVYFLVSCDAVLGQTHCSTAHIFPDTLCGSLAWNGADLGITGECQGDDVIFTITNNGAAMTEALDYVVIEDVMVQMTSNGSIQLGANESQTITLSANGSTWRLEVDQPTDYPWNTITSAAVEGCGENGQGTFSLGYIVQFPNNDESPFVDEDCQENVGSYDPNDKQGFPRGVNAQHFIHKDQEIEYMIRFQNTGTDTAFTVIVLDTLSANLNPASLRPLGSSHPYTWQVLGTGVVQFVFPQIMLPDSNVNEAASHGYIKFSIRPKTDLPDATIVENQAAIFFDFNLPIMTNRTWHTLGEQFLSISNVTFRPGVALDVWPNPTSAVATFYLKSATSLQGRLRVFDAVGREVATQLFAQNKFEWNAEGLMPGLYFFRLEAEDGTGIGAGRVSVVR